MQQLPPVVSSVDFRLNLLVSPNLIPNISNQDCVCCYLYRPCPCDVYFNFCKGVLGTNFPQSQPLVKDCQLGVSPVNYSDSDSECG